MFPTCERTRPDPAPRRLPWSALGSPRGPAANTNNQPAEDRVNPGRPIRFPQHNSVTCYFAVCITDCRRSRGWQTLPRTHAKQHPPVHLSQRSFRRARRTSTQCPLPPPPGTLVFPYKACRPAHIDPIGAAPPRPPPAPRAPCTRRRRCSPSTRQRASPSCLRACLPCCRRSRFRRRFCHGCVPPPLFCVLPRAKVDTDALGQADEPVRSTAAAASYSHAIPSLLPVPAAAPGTPFFRVGIFRTLHHDLSLTWLDHVLVSCPDTSDSLVLYYCLYYALPLCSSLCPSLTHFPPFFLYRVFAVVVHGPEQERSRPLSA